MEFIRQFFEVFLHYWQELWLILTIGFLLSGIVYKFIPAKIVERHLGEKGFKPILISSSVGILLPVCCMGSLPIAITLKRKGASLGAVLAFMVATPATSISALVVCWKLLGFIFTLVIFFAVIVMALIMGLICNGAKIQMIGSAGEKSGNCCTDTSSNPAIEDEPDWQNKNQPTLIFREFKEALRYAFVTLPKEIGVEILVGIAIASFITIFEPLQHLIREYLTGAVGYIFVLSVGLATYVCSTASVPLADALLQSGMSHGQALTYLLVGPITSYGTILVIKKDFGGRILTLYLIIICIFSLVYGIVFDLFY
jgi:uncharacterized protein